MCGTADSPAGQHGAATCYMWILRGGHTRFCHWTIYTMRLVVKMRARRQPAVKRGIHCPFWHDPWMDSPWLAPTIRFSCVLGGDLWVTLGKFSDSRGGWMARHSRPYIYPLLLGTCGYSPCPSITNDSLRMRVTSIATRPNLTRSVSSCAENLWSIHHKLETKPESRAGFWCFIYENLSEIIEHPWVCLQAVVAAMIAFQLELVPRHTVECFHWGQECYSN